jgi:type II secretory pathway component PulF
VLPDFARAKLEQLEREKKQAEKVINSPSPLKEACPEKLAELGLNPLYAAAQTVLSLTNLSSSDKPKFEELPAFIEQLAQQNAALQNGDTSQIEQILQCQAVTLNVAFNHWLIKANEAAKLPQIVSQKPELIEMFARLALKCQDQSRKTVATLAELKNPKRSTTFIKNYVDKQLNVEEPSAQATTRTAATLQLQENTCAPLDIGSERTPEAAHSEVATVEPLNRTSNKGRKTAKRPKQH